MTEERKAELLKDFLLEFFDFKELKSVGFFDNSINETDYQKQADRICKYFGLKTIYEYGAKTIRAHITYADRPKNEPFITEFKSIYE